jgi:hypothetical protein
MLSVIFIFYLSLRISFVDLQHVRSYALIAHVIYCFFVFANLLRRFQQLSPDAINFDQQDY